MIRDWISNINWSTIVVALTLWVLLKMLIFIVKSILYDWLNYNFLDRISPEDKERRLSKLNKKKAKIEVKIREVELKEEIKEDER